MDELRDLTNDTCLTGVMKTDLPRQGQQGGYEQCEMSGLIKVHTLESPGYIRSEAFHYYHNTNVG